MTQSPLDFSSEHYFQIKGGRISVTTLELTHYDYRGFNEQLSRAVNAAPQLFENMPIVIGLEKLPENEFVDFIEIAQLCQFHGVTPVAVRGGTPELQTAAAVAGLARLPAQGRRGAKPVDIAPVVAGSPAAAPAPAPAAAPPEVESSASAGATRVITAPVRSGQQVYARGGDLIVMAAVSAGAEILADGNIHVYGPLRG